MRATLRCLLIAHLTLFIGCDDGENSDMMVNNATINGSFKVTDYLLASGLEGVEVTVNEQTSETDAEGAVSLELPARARVHLEFAKESYYPYHVFLDTCGEGCRYYEPDGSFNYVQPLISLASGGILGDLFGIEVGAGDTGVVIATAFLETEEGLQVLSGAKIELDVAPTLTVAEDSSDALGLVEGTEIASGGLIFANVEAGDRTLTLTVPEGFGECSVNPGDTPATEATLPVYPQEVSALDFICKPTPQ